MKQQLLMRQLGILCLGLVGALATFGAAQASDDFADRYINGYLNDPYGGDATTVKRDAAKAGMPIESLDQGQGAQGPIRDDTAMSEDKPMGSPHTGTMSKKAATPDEKILP